MVQERSFIHHWGPPLGLCLTQFAVAYNVSVVPAIMPSVVRDLNSSLGYIQGALVLTAIVRACFAPTCEHLSQRYGRKRIFLGGLLLFTLGTIASCLSPQMGMFVVFYALITGIAATPLIASPRELVIRLYDDQQELRAQLALVVFSVLGGVAGGLLGGFIAYQNGWRWAFLPQLLLAPLIVLLVRSVPHIPPIEAEPLDLIGGVLACLGFGLTLLGISLAGEYGWWKPRQVLAVMGFVVPPYPISIVPPLILLGVICLGFFAAWQKRQANQGKASLLRVGLLRDVPFLLGLSTATLHTLITTGLQFNLYQFLPVALNLNPFQTALAIFPFSLTLLITVITSTFKLVGKVSFKSVIYIGLSMFCVGLWQLYTAIQPAMTPLDILPALVVMGAGSGIFLSQIAVTTFGMANLDARAEANGIYNPFQNLGTALGRAILGTVLVAIASAKIVDQAIAILGKTVSPTVRAQAIVRLTQVIQTYTKTEQQEFFKQFPAAVQPSLGTIIDRAAIEAMRMSVLITLILSILCLLLSMLIPKRRSIQTSAP